MSLAGSGGCGSEDVSFSEQMNESAGRAESLLVSNKPRHIEDVDENKETSEGCTDEANIVKVARELKGFGLIRSPDACPSSDVRRLYLEGDLSQILMQRGC